MEPLSLILTALGAAQQATNLYCSLRQLWSKQLSEADKAALAAKEEELFAQPHWRSPGTELHGRN